MGGRLIAVGVGVGTKHGAVGRTVRVETLAIDTVAAAVERAVGPHDHEAGIGATQPGNAGLRLVNRALPGRIGTGFAAQPGATGVVALEEDVAQFRESSVVVVVKPRDHKATVGRGRHG